MKIKENNEKITLKILPMIFAICSLSASVIRTLQMFKYIDHETGFTKTSGVISVIFYAVIAIGTLIFCITSYLSKESSKIQIQGKSNIFAFVGSLLFAMSLFYDWIDSIAQSTTLSITSTGNPIKDMMVSGSLPLIMQSFFALLSAIFFLMLAKDFFKGTSKTENRKILTLAPLGWVGFRLIHCFIRQISFVKVSDLFSELVMLSFMILFFLAFAQVSSSVYSDGFRWRIPAFGYSAAVIAFSLSIARLIYSLVNGADALNIEHPFNITDLAFAFFAVTLILVVTKKSEKECSEQVVSKN